MESAPASPEARDDEDPTAAAGGELRDEDAAGTAVDVDDLDPPAPAQDVEVDGEGNRNSARADEDNSGQDEPSSPQYTAVKNESESADEGVEVDADEEQASPREVPVAQVDERPEDGLTSAVLVEDDLDHQQPLEQGEVDPALGQPGGAGAGAVPVDLTTALEDDEDAVTSTRTSKASGSKQAGTSTSTAESTSGVVHPVVPSSPSAAKGSSSSSSPRPIIGGSGRKAELAEVSHTLAEGGGREPVEPTNVGERPEEKLVKRSSAPAVDDDTKGTPSPFVETEQHTIDVDKIASPVLDHDPGDGPKRATPEDDVDIPPPREDYDPSKNTHENCEAGAVRVSPSSKFEEGVLQRISMENEDLRQQVELLREENAVLKQRLQARPVLVNAATQTKIPPEQQLLWEAEKLLAPPKTGTERSSSSSANKTDAATEAKLATPSGRSGVGAAFAAFLQPGTSGGGGATSSRGSKVGGKDEEDPAEREARRLKFISEICKIFSAQQGTSAKTATASAPAPVVSDDPDATVPSLSPTTAGGIKLRNTVANLCLAVIEDPVAKERKMEGRMVSLQFLLLHWQLVHQHSELDTVVEPQDLAQHVRVLMNNEIWTPQTELLELRLQILRLLVRPMLDNLAILKEEIEEAGDGNAAVAATTTSPDVTPAGSSSPTRSRGAKKLFLPEAKAFRKEVHSLCKVALTDNIFVGEKRRACQMLLELGFLEDEFAENAALFDLLTTLLIETECGSPEASASDLTQIATDNLQVDLESATTKELLTKTLTSLVCRNLRLIFYAFFRMRGPEFYDGRTSRNAADQDSGPAEAVIADSYDVTTSKKAKVIASIKRIVVETLDDLLKTGFLSPSVFVGLAGPQILAAFVSGQPHFAEAEAGCLRILDKLFQDSQLTLRVLFLSPEVERAAAAAPTILLQTGAGAAARVQHAEASAASSLFPAPTETSDELYSDLYAWASALVVLDSKAPTSTASSYTTRVTENLLLWAVALPRMSAGTFRLQVLKLDSAMVIQKLLELFEAVLECVDQCEKDDLPYGVMQFRVLRESLSPGDNEEEEEDEINREYCPRLSRSTAVEPFLLALHELKLPTKWWPVLESSLEIVRTMLDHWDATSRISKAGAAGPDADEEAAPNRSTPTQLPTTSVVPDHLIALGFMDRLFELFEVPADLLTESLTLVAQDCMKVLLKKSSEICLFSLVHFVESKKNPFFVELACSAMEESDFFVEETEFLHHSGAPASSRNSNLESQNKFRLTIVTNLVDLHQKLPSLDLQSRLRRTLAALFDQASSIGLCLSVLQHYESEAQIGAGGGGGKKKIPNLLPLAVEMEVLRAIARLSYWNPGKETPLVVMLVAVLIDSIRESLHEEYTATVLNAVLHLLAIDSSVQRVLSQSLVAACANAFASNELKRKSLEKQDEPMGGIGLFDEEEEEEKKQSERELAVSFVMKVMQRFPTSDRVGGKAQHLLTSVLDSGM
ncbi:unnamed protein product [Amoebophrya sp. A120]|nr:unnamed protein product [Amoebophrya sp. A120]|eukprot:GSA120T00012901001.1